MKTIETKNLDIIENKLKEMKYEEIPGIYPFSPINPE